MSDNPGNCCVSIIYSRRSRRRRDDDLTLVSVPRHPRTTLFARRFTKKKRVSRHSAFLRSGCGRRAISIPKRRSAGDGAIRGSPREAPAPGQPCGLADGGHVLAELLLRGEGDVPVRARPRVRSRILSLPSRISRPLAWAPAIRAFSCLFATFRASSDGTGREPPARVSTRPPGHTPAPSDDARASLPAPRALTRSRASRRHPVAFRRLRLLAHRRCRSKTRNPARRSTTPPARARLCVSTSTRRSARGT